MCSGWQLVRVSSILRSQGQRKNTPSDYNSGSIWENNRSFATQLIRNLPVTNLKLKPTMMTKSMWRSYLESGKARRAQSMPERPLTSLMFIFKLELNSTCLFLSAGTLSSSPMKASFFIKTKKELRTNTAAFWIKEKKEKNSSTTVLPRTKEPSLSWLVGNLSTNPSCRGDFS